MKDGGRGSVVDWCRPCNSVPVGTFYHLRRLSVKAERKSNSEKVGRNKGRERISVPSLDVVSDYREGRRIQGSIRKGDYLENRQIRSDP